MASQTEKTPDPQRTYSVASAAGSSSVDPNVLIVRSGEVVYWTVAVGFARVLFKETGIVDFTKDAATPGSPAVATARKPGTHHHTISLWIGDEVPQAVRAVLIVE